MSERIIVMTPGEKLVVHSQDPMETRMLRSDLARSIAVATTMASALLRAKEIAIEFAHTCNQMSHQRFALLQDELRNLGVGVTDTATKCAKSAALYEKLRVLNPRQFAALWAENITTGVPFDDLVERGPIDNETSTPL
jgi:hypothetical protein